MTTDQEENPYLPPVMSGEGVSPTEPLAYQPPGPLLIFVVVVAAIIASAIAFFCSCVGFLMVVDTRRGGYFGPDWVIPLCGVVALAAFALTVRLGLKITRGPRIAAGSGDRGRVARTWGGIFMAAFLVGLTGFAVLAGFGLRMGFLSGIVTAAGVGTLVIWLSQKRWSTPEPEPPPRMESFTANGDSSQASDE